MEEASRLLACLLAGVLACSPALAQLLLASGAMSRCEMGDAIAARAGGAGVDERTTRRYVGSWRAVVQKNVISFLIHDDILERSRRMHAVR